MTARGSCPLEDGASLVQGAGVLGESACPACQGRMLVADVAERLMDEIGVERALITDLAEQHGGPALPCTSCGQKLRPLALRGVPVHLCLGCGSLWLSEGGLERLSDGHHREVKAKWPAPEVLRRDVAVLLESRAIAPEVLAAAVAGTRLTGVDARLAASRGEGIVSLFLGESDATLIVERLAAVEIVAHTVAVNDVKLPPSYDVLLMRPTDESLLCFDSAGKEIVVAWEDIAGIGVGRFRERNDSWRSAGPAGRLPQRPGRSRTAFAGMMQIAKAATVGELRPSSGRDPQADNQEQFWIVARAPRHTLRLRLRTAVFNEPAEGPRKPQIFRQLVTAVATRAPEAVHTRALTALLSDAAAPVSVFNDESAFERELIWTIWSAQLP